VTNFDEADVTDLEEYRSSLNEKAEHKISMTVMLIKIMSKALQAFPKLNASLDIEKQEVIYKKYFNIGFAVDTSRGLLIPVIKNVNEKSLEDIALELKELVDQSNKGKLSKADMSGGNIVLSNLGVLGTTNFVPLIFPPDAAILGVSKAQMKPVWDGKEFIPRTIMPMSLTYDHRLIDGADAARFLRWIGDMFEKPYRAIFE
jgi:pyruvate dehydrogenase E2 component (dihydrolipoamide acetyltransferase)